jgi:hypothetical protein
MNSGPIGVPVAGSDLDLAGSPEPSCADAGVTLIDCD